MRYLPIAIIAVTLLTGCVTQDGTRTSVSLVDIDLRTVEQIQAARDENIPPVIVSAIPGVWDKVLSVVRTVLEVTKGRIRILSIDFTPGKPK